MINGLLTKKKNRFTSDATKEEQSAIRQLVEKADVISPGTKLRFVQRDENATDSLLILSLSVPNINEADNFRLYALAHDLYEEGKPSMVVTFNSTPNLDQKLLRLKPFLPKQMLAVDVQETIDPIAYTGWTKRYRLQFLALLAFLLAFEIMYGQMNKWVHKKFPNLFPNTVERANQYVELSKFTLGSNLWDLEQDLKSSRFDHRSPEYKSLEQQRKRIVNALKDLEAQ